MVPSYAVSHSELTPVFLYTWKRVYPSRFHLRTMYSPLFHPQRSLSPLYIVLLRGVFYLPCSSAISAFSASPLSGPGALLCCSLSCILQDINIDVVNKTIVIKRTGNVLILIICINCSTQKELYQPEIRYAFCTCKIGM